MMKCEFEKLIGHEITPEEYQKVETVYMTWDYKEMSKEKIADLYIYDSKLVTETLYNYITSVIEIPKEKCSRDLTLYYLQRNCELEKQNEELETQLHQYKALFADIEKNATVALYETLIGVTE